MSKILKQALKYFYDANFRRNVNSILGFNHYVSDEEFLKRAFKSSTGYDLNLENPQTFNEKLQWLKLHDRKPEYTIMADKYEAKKYAAEIIGDEYIIPTLGIYDSFDEIDFDKLPEQFVLKCNHDCGSIIIVRDKSKFDRAYARKFLTKRLKRNYFWQGREWPYKNIKPRIIAEKLLGNAHGTDLNDYRFYCYNGVPKLIYCYTNYPQKANDKPEIAACDIFDCEWQPMPFHQKSLPREGIVKPKYLSKMIELASKLSRDIPFLRVDFYEYQGHLYSGELTFFPGGGMSHFYPEKWDYTLGSWLRLPDLDK